MAHPLKPRNVTQAQSPNLPLWLLIGLPGSGKSTWAKHFNEFERPFQIISTDQIRAKLFGGEAVQGPWMEVWHCVVQQFHHSVLQVQQGVWAGAIYDATNSQRRGRRKVIETARTAGFTRVVAVWFDVPMALCLVRNQQRSRQVPPDIIHGMNRHLVGAPPHCDEGFDAVYRLCF
ncbi:AAA family ATPase [Oscillatoria sp. CS-180]|uniref:AAA family ATPase n=1 Tax=Oscillatoria sp. CS-180 TaxID=3021720 RepID=UPI00232F6BAB|nr:AAA family ATPase [Oscillatoria sp. CS-180]MDB9528178.1 AAA family ATPase [Oscillatoria sp. CS-180]